MFSLHSIYITQIPGGWLAEKISAKHVFGGGVLLNALYTLLSPIAAKFSYICLVVIRICMGIAGVSFLSLFGGLRA